ncbi:antibiotic biosynthesis monooxygenase family protein [Rhizobium leguminosarum]|uniref:antibiotic biosynthesis monooxygenase family protein n=1 Tax=Rhizobium leguminosarum TaxID=384 RepID=UPI003CFE4CC1
MTTATIAGVWRGRTRREIADEYEQYLKAEGIPRLLQNALGVQLLREDLDTETWFATTSYWPDIESMTAFTKGTPTKMHHLKGDGEYLIELPEGIAIHTILVDRHPSGRNEPN